MTTIGLNGLPSGLRRWIWDLWYEYVARLLSGHRYEFLNFGYVPLEDDEFLADLPPEEMEMRPFIELYLRVVAPVEIEGQRVLEVSCGRGGGAHYIWERLGPRLMVAIDRSDGFVSHCQHRYRGSGLRFKKGDAEDLSFLKGNFEAIINIEASHAYGSRAAFLMQSHRLLSREGHLLIADFCQAELVEPWEGEMGRAGYEIVEREDISENVVRSLEMTDYIRLRAVRELSPRLLFPLFRNFAGAPGSRALSALRGRRLRYLRYALRKGG